MRQSKNSVLRFVLISLALGVLLYGVEQVARQYQYFQEGQALLDNATQATKTLDQRKKSIKIFKEEFRRKLKEDDPLNELIGVAETQRFEGTAAIEQAEEICSNTRQRSIDRLGVAHRRELEAKLDEISTLIRRHRAEESLFRLYILSELAQTAVSKLTRIENKLLELPGPVPIPEDLKEEVGRGMDQAWTIQSQLKDMEDHRHTFAEQDFQELMKVVSGLQKLLEDRAKKVQFWVSLHSMRFR